MNRDNPRASLLIGTAKDAGVVVYDLSGNLVQALFAPNAPHVSPEDPDTPAGENPDAGNPCVDSESGETFGRFNNADIAYDVRLGPHQRADVAVIPIAGAIASVSYSIDRNNPNGPLVDITAANVPRVFPLRYEQPSPLQPSGAVEGWEPNPVDDQNTVYGLTVAQNGSGAVFVTQRERGLVRQLEIVATGNGRLTYRVERTFLFRTSFRLRDERHRPYTLDPLPRSRVRGTPGRRRGVRRGEPDALCRVRDDRPVSGSASPLDAGSARGRWRFTTRTGEGSAARTARFRTMTS